MKKPLTIQQISNLKTEHKENQAQMAPLLNFYEAFKEN